MSGKWVKSAGGNDPVALVGIGILGIGASVALSAVAVLGKITCFRPIRDGHAYRGPCG